MTKRILASIIIVGSIIAATSTMSTPAAASLECGFRPIGGRDCQCVCVGNHEKKTCSWVCIFD